MARPMTRLDDKVAIVTGAARGLGRGVAMAMAAAGAKVALCDRVADKLAEFAATLDGAHHAVLDVRDPAAVEAFVADVVARCGRVDILVNNAGGGFPSAFVDVSPKGEAALIAENFTSVTSFCRQVIPAMPPGGSIINVTTVEAFRAAPGFAIYAAMKAGVESLTKTLALELAPRGIRVNSLAPDAIPTTGEEGLAATFGADNYRNYESKIPLGFGTVEAFADVAVFLASDAARYLTGDSLHVDGGSHAAAGWRRLPDGTYRP